MPTRPAQGPTCAATHLARVSSLSHLGSEALLPNSPGVPRAAAEMLGAGGAAWVGTQAHSMNRTGRPRSAAQDPALPAQHGPPHLES